MKSLSDEARRTCLSKKVLRENTESLTRLDSLLQEASGTTVRGRSNAAPVADPVSAMLEAKRETAYQEGYSAGYEWGFREGLQNSKKEQEERLLNFALELRALIGRIESAMELWYQKAEYGLAACSYDIARKVIDQELQARPSCIIPIVREAIGRVTNSTQAHIKVNPFDVPILEEHKQDILAISGLIRGVEIVGDERLERGSVIIESDNGVIDATVETKLTRIEGTEAA